MKLKISLNMSQAATVNYLLPSFLVQQYEWLIGAQYKPLEMVKSDWTAIRKSPPWAIDSWGLGEHLPNFGVISFVINSAETYCISAVTVVLDMNASLVKPYKMENYFEIINCMGTGLYIDHCLLLVMFLLSKFAYFPFSSNENTSNPLAVLCFMLEWSKNLTLHDQFYRIENVEVVTSLLWILTKNMHILFIFRSY